MTDMPDTPDTHPSSEHMTNDELKQQLASCGGSVAAA
jgi:hypothetical protein